MCLGVPGRIVEIDHLNGWAIVERLGVQNKVYTHLVGEEIVPGDYLMIHAGQAIGRMEPEDAEETLKLIEDIAAEMDFEAGRGSDEECNIK